MPVTSLKQWVLEQMMLGRMDLQDHIMGKQCFSGNSRAHSKNRCKPRPGLSRLAAELLVHGFLRSCAGKRPFGTEYGQATGNVNMFCQLERCQATLNALKAHETATQFPKTQLSIGKEPLGQMQTQREATAGRIQQGKAIGAFPDPCLKGFN